MKEQNNFFSLILGNNRCKKFLKSGLPFNYVTEKSFEVIFNDFI